MQTGKTGSSAVQRPMSDTLLEWLASEGALVDGVRIGSSALGGRGDSSSEQLGEFSAARAQRELVVGGGSGTRGGPAPCQVRTEHI